VATRIDVEACRAERQPISTVHDEISAEQDDSVASQRVEQLHKQGRRLLSGAEE
jgi:hypothetical protein